ncbi:MAG: beta-ketoacyl-[acyl-carrier-protein] synthase family protein [Verrucomicrobiota bacterium]
MSAKTADQRVVITGLGSVNAIGKDVSSFRRSLVEGISGVRPLSRLPSDDFPVKIAAEISHPAVDKDNFVEHDFLSRSSALAWLSAKEALEDAQLADFLPRQLKLGLVGSIGWRPHRESELKGEERMQPVLLHEGVEWLAEKLALNGLVRGCLSACAASTQSIGQACQYLLRGYADAMLAGGADSRIHRLGLTGYARLGVLTEAWNDAPHLASRPFDRQRNGFVTGEGGAFLVLETLQHAQARSAKIYAEVASWSATSDAFRVTDPQPDGEGAARCMHLCLERSNVSLSDVDVINAHGTSTWANDSMEARALAKVFGERLRDIPVVAMKSQMGHLSMAAGAAETVGAVLMMQEDQVPGTLNFHQGDADLVYSLNISNKTRQVKAVKQVLKNSFGFGGQNACLLLKKLDEARR